MVQNFSFPALVDKHLTGMLFKISIWPREVVPNNNDNNEPCPECSLRTGPGAQCWLCICTGVLTISLRQAATRSTARMGTPRLTDEVAYSKWNASTDMIFINPALVYHFNWVFQYTLALQFLKCSLHQEWGRSCTEQAPWSTLEGNTTFLNVALEGAIPEFRSLHYQNSMSINETGAVQAK